MASITASRLLVVSEPPALARALADQIEQGASMSVMVTCPTDRAPGVLPVPFDIVLVHLGFDLTALSWSLRMVTALGHPELVLVTSDAGDPTVAGLHALGVRHVLTQSVAGAWLADAAPWLVRIARARRALEAAKAGLPAIPSGQQGSPSGGLFQAEQRFRETYVRTLVARTTSHRDAASEARVSYRTLYHILKKLGLRPVVARS
jgi:hypothetical protein